MERCRERIPVIRPYMPSQEDFMGYARKIWENRWLTNGGPLVAELQEKLKRRLRVQELVVFANGHLALDCAIKALGLHGGEVITTPFTYLSTSHAISMNGLKPVFCDIKRSDCTIDEEKIEALITEKTRAILPVHVYGFPCNSRRIQEIADKHGLKVIYDAAHAFNVTVDGMGIGTLGDASMFSFHATKVYHTTEGGAVTYSDPALTQTLISAKNFGLVSPEQADSISFNAKMTELHAAMGLANLNTVDRQIERRGELVSHYLDRLRTVSEVELYRWDNPSVQYNYAYFPICVRPGSAVDRDGLAARLLEDYNVQVRKYFSPLVSDLNCYKQEYSSWDTPIAKDISQRIMALPLFVDLTHDQVDYICDAIQLIFTGKERGL